MSCSVEVTPLVQHPGSNLPGQTMDVIESSQVEVDTHNIQKRMDLDRMMIHDDDAQSRIYFSQLAANIASAILDAIRPSTVTLITTITVTRKIFLLCLFYDYIKWNRSREFNYDDVQNDQFFHHGMYAQSSPLRNLSR